ncbi:hypothetical protein OG594_24200 [Streptomyces sp. NBC_01214]|uniref:hypothetical protein n=1 Tax=Streptomyces sp. NBC_01214 TaxID=2903777 RepID=UPI0022572F05|nr:hypothetical protein [Streptomyces sp. NBC_01214]MCX4804681.1 hypothetical protein [Streptomyces sp. NBC_01214]
MSGACRWPPALASLGDEQGERLDELGYGRGPGHGALRFGVPDDQLAMQGQAVRQLRLSSRHQVRPPVLHQRPPADLHHHRAARPGRGVNWSAR